MLTLNLNLLWTVVNVLILFLLLRKFLYKPVMNVIAQRQKQIDDAIAAAETSKQDAAAALTSAEDKLRNVDAEAAARREAYEQPSWPRARLRPKPSASTSCARPTLRPRPLPAPCARSCWSGT